MKNTKKTTLLRRRIALPGLLLLSLMSILSIHSLYTKSLVASLQTTASMSLAESQLGKDAPNPFVNVIPDPSGRELYVNIYGFNNTLEKLYVNTKFGPTGRQYSYTATYSDTLGSYAATVRGLTPQQDNLVTLNVTSTTGINTPDADYPRIFMPVGIPRNAQAGNGRLELSTVNTDTFTNDTYLVFAPSLAPSTVVPDSHRVIGQPYTINASGSITASLRPMLLKFRYSNSELNGASPEALAIMQWQQIEQRWVRLTSRVFEDPGEVVTTIRRFTTYALMVTPTWYDDFDDLSGLDIPSLQNVDLKSKDGFVELLALTNNAITGVAISKPITPPVAIQQWDILSYNAIANPPTTTLTIDVLDHNGAILLANLPSGASLTTIDAAVHPALRLRASFTSTVPSQSASLDEWLVSWKLPNSTPTITPTVTPIPTLTITPTITSTRTPTATPTFDSHYIYFPEVIR